MVSATEEAEARKLIINYPLNKHLKQMILNYHNETEQFRSDMEYKAILNVF
jgi:hypothetical protein